MKIVIDIDGVLTNDDDFILDYATKFCFENGLDCLSNPFCYETRKFNWNETELENYIKKIFFILCYE